MWANDTWRQHFYSQGCLPQQMLVEYASVFNCVEGNTSFYALPSEQQVQRWQSQVAEDFRFCFKLPRAVTHTKSGFQYAQLSEFFQRLSPLADRLGPFMLQLPPHISAEHLPELTKLLAQLPRDFDYALELRHSSFFDGSDQQQKLQALCQRFQLSHMSFDTRALFDQKADAEDPYVKDARAKKPRFPIMVNAQGKYPSLRFIGFPWSNQASKEAEALAIEHSLKYFSPWIAYLEQWLEQGKTPFIFVHAANNQHAPRLAYAIHSAICARLSSQLSPLAAAPFDQGAAKQFDLI